MVKYALFIGCQIPARVNHYEISARAVLERLDVKLKEIRQFNCCGYPMRNTDKKAFLLSSVKNLALAEEAGLDMLVLCKCCYGNLKMAESLMKEEGDLQQEIHRTLKKHGLSYKGKTKIKHVLSVLYHEIGIDILKLQIVKKYKNLKIATHYGCHALRPSSVTEFDDPVSPSLFDALVMLTGAESVDWTKKLECCGAPLMGIDDGLSMDLARKKISSGIEAGADFLCTACPYSQMQFDNVQKMITSDNGNKGILPSILYVQLLGLSMGITGERLGIKMNQLDISSIISYLSEE